MRNMMWFVLLGSLLCLNACSDGSSNAPTDRNAHPSGWFTMHAEEALDNLGYTDCMSCHGRDLSGSGDAVSCYSCHAYSTEPPFTVHPSTWTNTYSDHRADAAANGFNTCAGCHGHDLRGRDSVPSCYAASFDGRACHADGPSEGVPHPVGDDEYLNSGHGQDAKADLTACQACHGELGGPGSNPRFNIGFGENACEDCHGINNAHPHGAWSSHYLAGNIQASCSLCHGVNLDGVGGVGGSCFDCHNESPGVYPTGCVSCHNVPPDGEAPVGNLSPNLSGAHGRAGHSTLISEVSSETCDRCHSGAGTGSDAHYDTTRPADVNLPLLPSDTIVPTSNATNTSCNGTCHIVIDSRPVN
jgi:hypothetical protein